MGTKFSEDSVKLERIKRSRNIWVSGLRTSFYMSGLRTSFYMLKKHQLLNMEEKEKIWDGKDRTWSWHTGKVEPECCGHSVLCS